MSAQSWRNRFSSARYVIPFAAFLLFLTLSGRSGIKPSVEIPLWTFELGLLCVACWPREIPKRPRHWLLSGVVGAVVFVLWIAPALIWPDYRASAVFEIAKLGVHSSAARLAEHSNPWLLAWRFARAVVIVPIVEELFWRAWLMRWLIKMEFREVPLGTYTTFSFWLTAVLFASEHGPFWDVGLIAGIIYNWWMVRTKSVADCILMHAVTNALLSLYVVVGKHWEYWG